MVAVPPGLDARSAERRFWLPRIAIASEHLAADRRVAGRLFDAYHVVCSAAVVAFGPRRPARLA